MADVCTARMRVYSFWRLMCCVTYLTILNPRIRTLYAGGVLLRRCYLTANRPNCFLTYRTWRANQEIDAECCACVKVKKVNVTYSWHDRATGRHLPNGITVLPATRHKCTNAPRPNPISIYLPWRNGRLSWPRLPGNAPAGSRTCDLSITSPVPWPLHHRATMRLSAMDVMFSLVALQMQ